MTTFEVIVSNKLADQIWLTLTPVGGQVQIGLHLQPQPNGSPPIQTGEGFRFKSQAVGIKPIAKAEEAAKLFDVLPKGLPLPIEVTYLINKKTQQVLIEVEYKIQQLN
jgi:hypothetical protein